MNITTSLLLNSKRHPEKMAVTCEGRTYSYKELNEEVNRLANGLLRAGLQKGNKVSLFMKNSDHYVIAFYAILKAGGVAVPVNFRLTSNESGYIFGQSESVLIICDAEFEPVIAEAKAMAGSVQQVIVHPAAQDDQHVGWDDIKSEDVSEPKVEVQGTDDAEILYTSGTTGKPKGALFDHQRIFNVNTSFVLGIELSTNDRLIHLAPLFHSAQLNLYLLTGIMLGTSNVIIRDFHPVKLMEAIDEHKITIFFGVPVMYNALLQVPNDGKYDLSSIRKCMYGAAPMAPALVKRAMGLFGTDQFYSLCGLTEGGPGGVYLLPHEHKDKLGAGGKSMYFTHVRVVNDELEDVKPGEIGEMIMKGETVMKEYYRKPEETVKTFSDGWLLTGDLATIDEDGFITIVDRKKDMIISGGENVYSVEVEQVINSHPQVMEAATIGFPDEKWGEVVGAVIVPKAGETIDEEEMMAYCRKHLAGYKIPRKFLYTDALPRNASGKILKYQLRELHSNEPA
ncbi:class I adenylate-forming enzyme family protein [Planococcus sp. YIM B11945]|uniref:class I adenylate-forming enzyme family protein n=1 Tax=Planococcus sp. YIM B11945 TaxID=3435410 RepID=UPI003D7EE4CD